MLAASARQAIEPFVERVCLLETSTSGSSYRFGYRIVGTDIVVAAIEIPAKLLEEAISSSLTLWCRLTPDGDVIPEASFEQDNVSSTGMRASRLSLDQLIRVTLAPQNLRMEEATIENLTSMLLILERSASIARDALARCTQRANEHNIQERASK
ncbi:hypothetical protein QMZ05_11360 [Bradyrhizobium sp. INPA03-11B]|uniref:hypothetical protein n=1 Tax=Bradyrhizobium sp. INPA03-11B TaxID=418598 RepID=UPI00338D73ED